MMEELLVAMQRSDGDVEQMSEEQILACLVADTEPTFPVRPFTSTGSGFAAPAGGFGA